jgi:hypothetical protein
LRHVGASADENRGKNHQITHGAYSLTDHDNGCDLATVSRRATHGRELRYLCEKDKRRVNAGIFGARAAMEAIEKIPDEANF